jgi:N-carbamoylputrescine amidase
MSDTKKRNKGQESIVRVAVCQTDPRVGEKEWNLRNTLDFIGRSCDQGAKLIVLPELCNSGYVFDNRAEAYELSEEIPNGPSCKAWIKAAQEKNVYIVAGIAERDGLNLYNSSVLIGPEGYIGLYRKLHNWYEEKLFFEEGNLGLPVFQTKIGRIAMIICYDKWFPEVWRICALKGADIICSPTAWVPHAHEEGMYPLADYLCMAAAHCNSVFVAVADRTGTERETQFVGYSIIVGPDGLPLAGPASADKEEILIADCNLSEARKSKHWNEFNGPIRDRRTDVYDYMLGYKE